MCDYLRKILSQNLDILPHFLKKILLNDKKYSERFFQLIIDYLCENLSENDILDFINFIKKEKNINIIYNIIQLYFYTYNIIENRNKEILYQIKKDALKNESRDKKNIDKINDDEKNKNEENKLNNKNKIILFFENLFNSNNKKTDDNQDYAL